MSVDKAKLNKLINKLADEPFKYGKNDCFLFTNALVKEWHGQDFSELHPYKNAREAASYMKAHGGIEALTTGTLGYPARTDMLVDGDVVLGETNLGPALGFVYKGHGLFKAPKTVLKIKLSRCIKGWMIQCLK